ncbi:Rft protein-domain-containing protein [Lactarius hatsudake]|nr:Rft protein-domain-containing protein [Lactarius hatsudake]
MKMGNVVGLLDITKVFHEALDKVEHSSSASEKLYSALAGVQSELGTGLGANPQTAAMLTYVEALREKTQAALPDLTTIIGLRTQCHGWPKSNRLRCRALHVKDAYFDQDLLHLSGAMTARSVVKHFLTEGDKLLISHLSPLADQGGYAIASNYGSPVARVVFHPIEETSRIFSKSLSSSPASSSSENDQEALGTAVELLSSLLLLFTHFLLLVFGPPYLPLATVLVPPPQYQQTSMPRVLRAFRFYLPTMAYNGVPEAFLASVCTPADLRAQSRMMAAASAALIATALAGAALVWANTASMAARAVPHRQRETKRALGLAALRPPLGVLVAFAAAAVCTRWSAAAHADVRLSLWAQRWYVALGGACLDVCLVVCYVLERRRFLRTITVLRRSRK